MRDFYVKTRINKSNRQINVSLPRLKLPKRVLNKIHNKSRIKICIKDVK